MIINTLLYCAKIYTTKSLSITMSFSQDILTSPSRRSSDVDDLNLILTSFIFENDLSVQQLETGNCYGNFNSRIQMWEYTIQTSRM